MISFNVCKQCLRLLFAELSKKKIVLCQFSVDSIFCRPMWLKNSLLLFPAVFRSYVSMKLCIFTVANSIGNLLNKIHALLPTTKHKEFYPDLFCWESFFFTSNIFFVLVRRSFVIIVESFSLALPNIWNAINGMISRTMKYETVQRKRLWVTDGQRERDWVAMYSISKRGSRKQCFRFVRKLKIPIFENENKNRHRT